MLRKSIRDGSVLWLGLILLIALCIAFLLPVTPQDYWWYLRVGQQTAATGVIPAVDTFTYSIAGQPIYYHSWGASVLFWLIYSAGGLTLTVLLRGLVVAITYALLWFTARRAGAGKFSASLTLLAAVLASSNNWSIRPQLLVYPLFALSVWILYRWQDGAKKAVGWLIPIACLWGNLHASFVLLVLLTAAALVWGKGDRRVLACVFVGILAAVCLNPRGWQTWQYVVQLLISPSNQGFSQEWSPPVNIGWQMNLFFLWLLAFPLLAVFSSKKLSALEWCWFAGFGFLALWGLRYGIWFILVLAILTAKLLSGWEEKWLLTTVKKGSLGLNLGFFLILIFSTLTLLPGVRESWWQQAPTETEDTPVAATEWLKAHPQLQGPLFAEMGFASYLEFALPERPVWIDSRVFPFSTSMWQNYVEINSAAWDWQSSLADTGANLLMISPQVQPKLTAALSQSTDWCDVYADGIAQIYTRGGCVK